MKRWTEGAMVVEANRERKKKMWLTLDSLGLFLTRGRGKKQMSDKFWRLRGVLIISPVPCCVKSCSLTGGDRRGRWDRSLYSSVGFTCMPKLLLNGICKVILLMIAIVEEAHRERSGGKKLETAITDQTRLAFRAPRGCVLKQVSTSAPMEGA